MLVQLGGDVPQFIETEDVRSLIFWPAEPESPYEQKRVDRYFLAVRRKVGGSMDYDSEYIFPAAVAEPLAAILALNQLGGWTSANAHDRFKRDSKDSPSPSLCTRIGEDCAINTHG